MTGSILTRRPTARLVLAAVAAIGARAVLATLVVPPDTGYWGAYNRLELELSSSPLILGVTPDTALDDPGPAGEEGKAAVVLHVRAEHRDLVASMLSGRYTIKKSWDEPPQMLTVPIRVEGAELVERAGTLRAIPWIDSSINFPLARHDYELVPDTGPRVPVLLAGQDVRWPGPTNPAIGQEATTPVAMLAARVRIADTIVPHNPATAMAAGRREVLLARALVARGHTPRLTMPEPADGVELLAKTVGRMYSVYHVTADHRSGHAGPGRVLVTLSDFDSEGVASLLAERFAYRGTTYHVATRPAPATRTHAGTLERRGPGIVLVHRGRTTPALLSEHLKTPEVEVYVRDGVTLEVEGYMEEVPTHGKVLFAVRLNPSSPVASGAGPRAPRGARRRPAR